MFNDNLAYIGDGVYYAVIDVAKGVKLLETEFPHKINVHGNLIHFMTCGAGLVFHEGFLFFTFSENGSSYLVKISPSDGRILDSMLLDSKTDLYAPLFHDNRVYILDQDRQLFIYKNK